MYLLPRGDTPMMGLTLENKCLTCLVSNPGSCQRSYLLSPSLVPLETPLCVVTRIQFELVSHTLPTLYLVTMVGIQLKKVFLVSFVHLYFPSPKIKDMEDSSDLQFLPFPGIVQGSSNSLPSFLYSLQS